ncbi:glucuronate isomerase [Metabacillus arenae]|uniref:Uronate isomerase n=1 Tax=Metabacillus arenae TaxID=2771434 RepID=A0A926NJK9_9BACI|nr:glucuronate isomerase [Metabacillus arenae]MBD1382541.1 glucuronate isomerase [Metabacillus arenae]
MTVTFIKDDFLLKNKWSKMLYHDYAEQMPIFDFHCHLDPKEIAQDKTFLNLTDIWLKGDHYKWRAMRAFGIEEKYITGEASDYEKFLAWSKTLPYTIGNPLYHWSHLELKRYFGIDELLTPQNADRIWELCNEQLQQESFSAQGLIKKFNVKVICTTDDPTDNLEWHEKLDEKSFKVVPTFRPDKLLAIGEESFPNYLLSLEQETNRDIQSFDEFIQAIRDRMDYFHKRGCRGADHGFSTFPYAHANEEKAEEIFYKAKQGVSPTYEEQGIYQSYLLTVLGEFYHDLGWVMQMHIGALRNNNTKKLKQIGRDIGCDSIRDFDLAESLNSFFDELDQRNKLPKTIIYNLNPSHNDIVATTIGNFQAPGIKGKMQFGSGWWFNDQKDGMEKQLLTLANQGLLSTFVGMLTDSRSFLSYPRHEYFRRILCNLFGTWINEGELPEDPTHIGSIIQDICYHNAANYFPIEERIAKG